MMISNNNITSAQRNAVPTTTEKSHDGKSSVNNCNDHGHSHNHATDTKTGSHGTTCVSTSTTDNTSNNGRVCSGNANLSSYLDHRHDNTPEMIQQKSIIQKLYIALGIISFFLIVEMIGGYIAQSLAIWSDAAHLISDMAAMMVALLAAHLGTFPVSSQHTFGLKRVESLAALFSTMSLLCISIGLAYEAIRRIYSTLTIVATQHQEVNGRLMSIIAFIGVLVNLMLAYVLGEHHVHLPSDDHDCKHGHDHTHEHHGHNHNSDHTDHHHLIDTVDDHVTTTSTTKNATTGSANSHAGCSSHNHSHDHHFNQVENDHGHDHDHAGACRLAVPGSSNVQRSTESTPLLPATTIGVVQQQGETLSKWKIPFSPQNINLQAAYLHVLGDLAQSATVLIAGCIIWIAPSFTIIDPICTLLFCLLVFYSAYHVCRTSIAVLLQQVPSHLNYFAIRDKIASVQYVQDVHDLHIWSISHRVPALSVHVSIAYPPTSNASVNNNTVTVTPTTTGSSRPIHDEVLENIYTIVRREFDIIHATIQIQSANGDCVTCVDRLCRPCILEELQHRDSDTNIDIGNAIV